MDDLTLINNTSVYRNPAPQSPLQGQNVLQPATVYSKIMLKTIELAESDYVFDALATERMMPSNNGANEITFKRMLSLAAHTQPLTEGIPPASDQGRMVAIKASTAQYGRVMKFTDKVNWAVVDPLISEYTRQLSLKIPETKDLLAQKALLSECQMFYACEKAESTTDADIYKPITGGGMVTHITRLTPNCTPTVDEFRQIVLQMEAAKVRPYQGSNFLVLASSAVLFDLITDKRVKEFMAWEQTAKAYSTNMVIDLFNLAFKKAKTIKTDNTFINADGNICYLYHAPSVSFAPAGSGTAAVPVGYTGSAYTGAINFYTVGKPYADAAGTDTVYISYVGRDSAGAYKKTSGDASFTKTVFAAAVSNYDVLNTHYSYVLGEECLFRVGIEGHTAPEFITKPLGSSGVNDPLNQRQSIGWKIDSLGYKVPNPDAVVAYVAVPTQYRVNINARPDLKNQFTDYDYGYVDASGNFYYPEQVMETLKWNSATSTNVPVYVVRGTGVEVTAQKFTKLVQPVNGGRIDANGKKEVVKGTLPTEAYALASNHSIRFMADQVAPYPGSNATYAGKWYIKGFEGSTSSTPTTACEVVKLPQTWTSTEIKADGTGTESRTAIDEGTPISNLTGDKRIDG